MQFTYHSYKNLLTLLREYGYEVADYHNWLSFERCVILRHDVDYDLTKAVQFAQLEAEQDVRSTYFVLLTSDFYNVFSKRNTDYLRRIIGMGHNIGLHFDEARYEERGQTEVENSARIVAHENDSLQKMILHIREEADLLGHIVDAKVDTVSMHRPSKMLLEADIQIPGMVNSYSKPFFKEFKYISDSRRRWREPLEEIVSWSAEYKRLHVLTHAFWYHDTEEGITKTIRRFINRGCIDRYTAMDKNITDLSAILSECEVLREDRS